MTAQALGDSFHRRELPPAPGFAGGSDGAEQHDNFIHLATGRDDQGVWRILYEGNG